MQFCRVESIDNLASSEYELPVFRCAHRSFEGAVAATKRYLTKKWQDGGPWLGANKRCVNMRIAIDGCNVTPEWDVEERTPPRISEQTVTFEGETYIKRTETPAGDWTATGETHCLAAFVVVAASLEWYDEVAP